MIDWHRMYSVLMTHNKLMLKAQAYCLIPHYLRLVNGHLLSHQMLSVAAMVT